MRLDKEQKKVWVVVLMHSNHEYTDKLKEVNFTHPG
jgi:alpha-beta hydrolase superfamily lysophospholipase